MSISNPDIIRALKSESWFGLDNVCLDDLPAHCFRDLDFGDVDSSVFLIPSLDWANQPDVVKTHLDRILLRILLSSTKFHKKRIILFKMDKTLFSKDNLKPLDEKLGCEHYDLVGVTYGLTKKMIEDAYQAIKGSCQERYRIYGIADIRTLISNCGPDELKKSFLEINPNALSFESDARKRAVGVIQQIKNAYFKRMDCPLTEELIFGTAYQQA